MEVKVTKLVQRNANNALKAFADVEITEGDLQFTIYGVKVFTSQTKGDYIGLPATPPKEPMGPNGKPSKWFDIVALNKTTFFKVQDAVLAAYQTGEVTPSAKAVQTSSLPKSNGFGTGITDNEADDDGVAPF
jgi:DNA-binding cell septation regulator SpoVG